MKNGFSQYRYFILTGILLVADQLIKIIVVRTVPIYTISWNLWGDFFQLIHVRNLGAAFSLGSGVSEASRIVFFIAFPLLFLGSMMIYIIRGRDLTVGQRWTLAAIVGGGLGNQIDRIFRPGGVVDYLDFKFYGLFGMERWPTFNLADASMVVASLVLILQMILQLGEEKRAGSSTPGEAIRSAGSAELAGTAASGSTPDIITGELESPESEGSEPEISSPVPGVPKDLKPGMPGSESTESDATESGTGTEKPESNNHE